MGGKTIGDSSEKIIPAGESYHMQILSAIVVSLSMVTTSYTICWVGPALLKFSRPEEFIPITSTQAIILSSLYPWGCIPGQVISTFLNDYFGRRNTLVATSVPFIFANGILFWSQTIEFLYLSRLLSGFAGGIVFSSLSVYLSEISTSRIRGFVGTFSQVAACIGEVGLYIIVPYTSVRLGCMISSVPAVFLLLGGFFIPESPYFYFLKHSEVKAKKSLSVLRSCKNVDKELAVITKHLEKKSGVSTSIWTLFTEKSYRKSFFIVLLLFFAQQCSGMSGINTYGPMLLDEAPTFITAEMGGIISTIAHVAAVLYSCATVDHFGRRPLLLWSSGLSAIPTFFIGVYTFLKAHQVDFYKELHWLPVVCIIFFKVTSTFGLNACSYIVLSEIIPTHLRAFAVSVVSLYGSILGLIVIYFHGVVMETFGQYYVYWTYTIVCTTCMILMYYVLPETKRQRLEEIEDKMALS